MMLKQPASPLQREWISNFLYDAVNGSVKSFSLYGELRDGVFILKKSLSALQLKYFSKAHEKSRKIGAFTRFNVEGS